MPEGNIATETVLKKQLPKGEAEALKEQAIEKWKERLLIFAPVANTVILVNPDLNLPFSIEVGKSAAIGLFAESALNEKPIDIPPGKRVLQRLPTHMRSALFLSEPFSDKDGEWYRDIDIKGVGYLGLPTQLSESRIAIVSTPGKRKAKPDEDGRYERYGLLDKPTVLYDYEWEKKFTKAGIRTVKTVAITALHELIVDEKKISLDEAIRNGIVDPDFNPVIQARAFGTLARVRDLQNFHVLKWLEGDKKKNEEDIEIINSMKNYQATSDMLLKDAKKLIAQELGKKTISDKEYLEWFARTLGENVAVIHKNGWQHNYLHDQNITLDCRIVDFDGSGTITTSDSDGHSYSREMDLAKRTIAELFERVKPQIRDEHFDVYNAYRGFLLRCFQESYDAVFSTKKQKKYLN